MKTWQIDALDPLLFSDGRPLSAGDFSNSLLYPYPSTLAGAVRTRHGQDPKTGVWKGVPEEVRKLCVQGPFLMKLGLDGSFKDWLLPSPADAVEMEGAAGPDSARSMRHLQPLSLPDGAQSNGQGAPVGFSAPDLRKPYKKANPLWLWSELKAWLTSSGDQSVPAGGWGCPAPLEESRMHVSIVPETGTADDGKLFRTRGRRWLIPGAEGKAPAAALALAVRTDAALYGGLGVAGGEQRFVRWTACTQKLPACPEEVLASAERSSAVRLYLATPGLFRNGSTPADCFGAPEGSIIVGQASQRPQVVSGWDLEKGRPKPTRRLVPAGAVYFLTLGGDAQARRAWAEQTWLASVADDAQDRLDGFGIALLGTWSGKTAAIKQ